MITSHAWPADHKNDQSAQPLDATIDVARHDGVVVHAVGLAADVARRRCDDVASRSFAERGVDHATI